MRVNESAASLLDAAVAALGAAGLAVPSRRYVAGGLVDLIAWDRCGSELASTGDCGQLTVGLSRLFRSTSFPTDTSTTGRGGSCDLSETVAEFGVEIVGCAMLPDDDGVPPSAGDLDAEGEAMMRAAEALWCAAIGWAAAYEDDAIVTGSLPLGPEGGCIGFRVFVAAVVETSGEAPGP